MPEIRDFRDLRVWQLGVNLCPEIYALARRLPLSERFALGDQMRRAVVSIPANIAEGHARNRTKAYLNHLSIATGSTAEVQTLIAVGERLGYFAAAETEETKLHILELRRTLYSLRASLQRVVRS